MGSHWVLTLLYLKNVLYCPEDDRLRSKHVAVMWPDFIHYITVLIHCCLLIHYTAYVLKVETGMSRLGIKQLSFKSSHHWKVKAAGSSETPINTPTLLHNAEDHSLNDLHGWYCNTFLILRHLKRAHFTAEIGLEVCRGCSCNRPEELSVPHSLMLLRMGDIIARNMLNWLNLLIKLLLLHLIGCLCYYICQSL